MVTRLTHRAKADPVFSVLTAGSGTYNLNGIPLAIRRSAKITAAAGSYSLTGLPVSFAVNAAQPSFVSAPTPSFYDGAGQQTYDFVARGNVTGFSSTNNYYELTAGSLAGSNVTLNSAVGLVYSGSGGTSIPTGLQVTIQDTATADWQARSGAAGVMYAEDWSTYATALDYHNFMNRGGMVGHLNNKFSNDPQWNDCYRLVSDAGHMRTGKAFRLYLGAAGYPNSGGIDYQSFNILFNGNPLNVAGAFRTSFYMQCTFWVDSSIDYFWRQFDGSLQAMKFLRIDDETGTNTGEIVINNQYTAGFVTAYRRDNNGNPLFDRSLSTPANSGNRAWQPAIDNETALSDQNSYERRYGPMEYGMSGGTSQATRLHTQANTPDPDAAIGGIVWVRGGLTTVEIWANLATDSCKIWAGPTGSAPKLIINQIGGCGFGSRVMPSGIGWNVVNFTNLAYNSTGASNPGYPSDAYIDYSQLIVSTSPINFPGGFSLP